MRHRKTRDIVIELTSLLDVVMILIFAVMIENTKLTQASQTGLEEANAQIDMMQEKMEASASSNEELEELLDKLANEDQKELVDQLQKDNNMLQAYEYLDNIVVAVNISLENHAGKRKLTFGIGAEEESYKVFDVDKKDNEAWNEAVNQLKIFVSDAMINEFDSKNANRMAYLIFTADYSRVYAKDFNTIENALMSMASKNEKIVYYTNRLNEEEDKQ